MNYNREVFNFTPVPMSDLDQPLYSVAQIRQLEHLAEQNYAISPLQMMRAAGLAAFNLLQQRWPQIKQLTLFCGAGNNAGDGFVLAELALQSGYQLTVYSLSNPDLLTGAAKQSFLAFVANGGVVETGELANVSIAGIVIDALLGTGLNRPVTGDYALAIAAINASGCPVLAIDVPSGLQADTGYALQSVVEADLTITFIGLKLGLFTGQAADYCGEIICADLDLPQALLNAILAPAVLLAAPTPVKRKACVHKGQMGHVLAIGGNHGYSGAIRLAAEAALRTGAGLVSVATRASHHQLINQGRPELMCHAVESELGLAPLLAKATVVIIGPGLGQDAWAQQLFARVMQSGLPCVVDADALNLLAVNPCNQSNWILTPHPGEAARLLAATTDVIAKDRFAAVKSLQANYGGVCVLKGAGSLIFDGIDLAVSVTGNPGMASGGMGDVLAGMIAGLLAQGWSYSKAAQTAVYLHGAAADQAVRQSGQRGLLASDLMPFIRSGVNGVEGY